MFEGVDRQLCVFAAIVIATNSYDMFNVNELKEGARHLANLGVGVQDVLATMQATPRLFKILINFTLAKFDELLLFIVHHAQFTCEHHIQVLDLSFTLKF